MPSKRYKKALEVVDGKKAYPLKEAVGVLAKFPKAKLNETIPLAFRLGVDPKQSDQMVRGTCRSPTAAARVARVLVFAKKGEAAEAARAAGAEYVGFEDMIDKCQEGCPILMSRSPHPQRWRKSASSAKCSDPAA